MPSQDLRLSVCLSVTRRYSVDISSNFLPSGSFTILVFFPYQTEWQYSDCYPIPNSIAVSVDHTDRHASVNLIYHVDEYAEEKRTEQNIIYL